MQAQFKGNYAVPIKYRLWTSHVQQDALQKLLASLVLLTHRHARTKCARSSRLSHELFLVGIEEEAEEDSESEIGDSIIVDTEQLKF